LEAVEAVNLTVLGTGVVSPDPHPLGRSKESPVWVAFPLLDSAPEPCPAATSVGAADDNHRGATTVVAPMSNAATPTRAFFLTGQTRSTPVFFSPAGSARTFPPARFRRPSICRSANRCAGIVIPAFALSKPDREAPLGSSPSARVSRRP
jgi:hypothetical protein